MALPSKRAPARKRSKLAEDDDSDFVSAKPAKKMRVTSSVRLHSVESVVSMLRDSYQRKANARLAPQMKKYLRNQFDFFGIPTPERRGVYPAIHSSMGLGEKGSLSNQAWPADQLVLLIQELWRLPEREFQHFALDLAQKQRPVLCADFDTAVDCARLMITERSWWDTVDMVASHIVGYIVQQHKKRGEKLMDSWIDHDCMWLRRTAILHQLTYKNACNEERLFRYCLKRAHEEEFFIRKAIGWALRDYARVSPVSVKLFVLLHEGKFSTLSKREALKHLSAVKC